MVIGLTSCSKDQPELITQAELKKQKELEGGGTETGSTAASGKAGTAARIGNEVLLAAIDKCNGAGKFYNRTVVSGLGDAATEAQYVAGCTSENLSSITCNKETVVNHTRTKSKSEEVTAKIENNINAVEAEGFEFDQCVVCLKGNSSDFCAIEKDGVKSPPSIDIMKIFFADKLGNTRNFATVN